MKKLEERIPITIDNQGNKLFGVLHLPNNGRGKSPGVLICHGLAGHKTGKHRVYVDIAYKLACQGIATLRFDYRGCGDSEGHFHEVTPSLHLNDALLFLQYLMEHPKIDNELIGILGRSYGGAVAVKAAAQSACIRSLVLWCPMFSGEQWQDQWQLIQTNSVDEQQMKAMMQIEGQQGSYHFFDEFFCINVTRDLEKLIHIPMLHIHGEVDSRVDIQHAHDYEACRDKSIALNKFLKLPNTDHDFSHIDEREHAINETLNWFVDTLSHRTQK